MKTTKYADTVITPACGGFGEWEQGRAEASSDKWDDEDALVSEMREGAGFELFELGEEDLPEGLDDIRGRIRNQSGRIFGGLDDHGIPRYFAVVAVAD